MSAKKRRPRRRPVPHRQHSCGRRERLSIASTRVVDGSEPVRLVVHALDGSWQFLDGLPTDVDHLMLTHAHHLFDDLSKDLGPLRHLPVGHVAERQGPGFPWRIVADVQT